MGGYEIGLSSSASAAASNSGTNASRGGSIYNIPAQSVAIIAGALIVVAFIALKIFRK